MYGDLTRLQKAIADAQTIAATVFSRTAGIRDGLVYVDTQWKIALQKLIGNVGERWPQRVSVRPIPKWLSGNSAKRDLVQLIPITILVVARIHEVRRVRESSGTHELRIPLSEKAAQYIEDSTKRMSAARQRRWLQRLQKRA